MTLYGEDKMSIEEIIARLSKMGEANLAANLVKIRQTITRLTAENAELRERLKGMCTIEVDPKCELAKESKEGM
jgi:hypothetical protein